MYSLLIVDDEYYAVEAMLLAVDWKQIGIDHLYTAMSADEARSVLEKEQVDIMICDIEMPEEDGLSLQIWVQHYAAQVETIFLTGHAEFSYAQKAIQLHSFDYLLKPINSVSLMETVKRALEKRMQNLEFRKLAEVYEVYIKEDHSWKPKRLARFWKDLYSSRYPISEAKINELKLIYHVDLDPGTFILPILFRVEEWLRKFPDKDLDILEFGLCNAAEEFVLDGNAGDAVADQRGYVLVLLYASDKIQTSQVPDTMEDTCKDYMDRCTAYLSCRLSCYIGEWTPLKNMPEAYRKLLQVHRHNVAGRDGVYYIQASEEKSESVPELVPLPWAPEFSLLMETGKIKEVLQRADELIDWMQEQKPSSAELLQSFYHALLHSIYPLLHKNGIALHSIYLGEEPQESDVTRSFPALREWAHELISRSGLLIHPEGEDTHSTVKKVCLYIDARLEYELGREEIADFIGFHPAYLSRFFKKEMDMSLSSYILHARVQKAQELLLTTSATVTDIASKVGYFNYTHFTKMFKKYTGLTPQQYRRQIGNKTEEERML
ncbi:helix-turn-helix domain-containing protein [Paenibacillus sp. Marseille-Q4541]|uniref:helix-turn-helix domain-containing protein n=1 Tax=Paenibacillus sp. Marseille-Q4541 TaxID=2831522 RepID=UPI001BAD3804|nr:helix-turn-helix domain-containing protein [Paenibacillus sp. Marseille-Q4541]